MRPNPLPDRGTHHDWKGGDQSTAQDREKQMIIIQKGNTTRDKAPNHGPRREKLINMNLQKSGRDVVNKGREQAPNRIWVPDKEPYNQHPGKRKMNQPK